jgi:hypothetical protein
MESVDKRFGISERAASDRFYDRGSIESSAF